MVHLLWNQLRGRINAYQVAVAMLLALPALLLLTTAPLFAFYVLLAAAAVTIIHQFHFKGLVAALASTTLLSILLYFSSPEVLTSWLCFWIFSLCIAFYLLAEGEISLAEYSSSKEKMLKQETESALLWKSRFETLQYQLQKEKEKITSLEQDMILMEEKHEERIDALKQLIELTSSESARDRHRLEQISLDREIFRESAHTLSLEIETLKNAVKEQQEPLFTQEEALSRLQELNESRFDNFQLRLLLTEQHKERKIQEKVKRERSPRASTSLSQEKITLQDLAKVISKNIK